MVAAGPAEKCAPRFPFTPKPANFVPRFPFIAMSRSTSSLDLVQENPTPRDTCKVFVLDTNVLLHDPDCLFKFEEHTIVIPVEVLAELDRKKTATGDLGFSARKVHRILRDLFGNLPSPTEHTTYKMEVPLPTDGQLRIVINEALITKNFPEGLTRLQNTVLDLHSPDNRILASALYVQATEVPPVILVTKDANMALKAQALGLAVQDYKNDRVDQTETHGYAEIPLTQTEWFALAGCDWEAKGFAGVPIATDRKLLINEYVLVSLDCGAEGKFEEPARHLGGNRIVPLPLYREFCRGDTANGDHLGLQMPGGIKVVPRNFEQWTLLDAILNPRIGLVTVKAKAGTGKTFVAIAAALHEVLSDNSHWERVLITRPNVDMGNGIGYLPGDLEDKVGPYMQPYFDNLDQLFPTRKKPKNKPPKSRGHGTATNATAAQNNPPQKPWKKFQDMGMIQIEAMNFIRGRSLPNCLMIVDEAQNMTPHQAKTVVTRMGEGSKIILMGDPAQIDAPFLDSLSNGLVYVRDRMRDTPLTAHIKLIAGVRSEIAELGADLL